MPQAMRNASHGAGSVRSSRTSFGRRLPALSHCGEGKSAPAGRCHLASPDTIDCFRNARSHGSASQGLASGAKWADLPRIRSQSARCQRAQRPNPQCRPSAGITWSDPNKYGPRLSSIYSSREHVFAQLPSRDESSGPNESRRDNSAAPRSVESPIRLRLLPRLRPRTRQRNKL